MKVLVATAMYPTPERPGFGSFVRTQVESLKSIGADADPFVLEGGNRKIMTSFLGGGRRETPREGQAAQTEAGVLLGGRR